MVVSPSGRPAGRRFAVVVPHFRQPEQLARLLTALELQTVPAGRLAVAVADDGSPEPLRPGPRPYPVRVVRQPDLGFRAAAARNLGARAVPGDLVVFLDADMVPEPGFLAALAAADDRSGPGPGRLLVGRRRHARLTGWDAAAVRAWLTGGPGPAPLPEPEWLAGAYRRSRDLADADDRSYRFLISALMAMPRRLFEQLGGFEERFVGYGGEDWELANRAWLAGADFRHVPDAVAWHDGPDLAGRLDPDAGPDQQRRFWAARNRESADLAALVTEPGARGRGLVWDQPDVLVEVDDRGAEVAQVLLCCAGLLEDSDAQVWLRSGRRVGQDPRIRAGRPDAATRARARYLVQLSAPVELGPGGVRALCERAPVRLGAAVLARRTRDLARGMTEAPWSPGPGVPPPPARLEPVWNRRHG